MGGNGKVLWRVEVGRDGDGAFLGRGWPELADACGVGAGWLLVLRHRGRGVLTFKAFDDTRCLRDLVNPAPPPGNKDSAPLQESRIQDLRIWFLLRLSESQMN